jgi:hypothetical protein
MGTDIAIDIAARVSGATTDVATRVTGAIRDAARQTGAGFEYLLNTALRESNLNPNAKAKTSSATGLFQFIDQTWLGTMKQSGAALGYGKYADAISRTPQGRYVVNDPAMREAIFALRKDPTANAVMAGAFANSNAKVLTERLGRKPTDGELYIAHFLGASGAARFISAAEARPDAKAASFFPRAAAANSSIFYDKQGGAKSLKQVYAGLIAKHDVIGTSRFAAAHPETVKAAVAAKAVGGAKPATEVAARKIEAPLPTALFRDITPPKPAREVAPASSARSIAPSAAATNVAPVKAVTPVQSTTAMLAPGAAGAAPQAAAFAAEPAAQPAVSASEPKPKHSGPMFQTLFHEDERGAVAPVVRELWGARRFAAVEATGSAATSAPVETPAAVATPAAVTPAAATAASGASSVNAPLDLFRFLRPSRGA